MKTPKKIHDPTTGKRDYPRTEDGKIDYSKGTAKIMTSRDGYLKIAQGHPEYVGPPISFAVSEGDEFEIDAENYAVKHKFGAKRGRILGAWSRCDRKGKNPSICYVPFSEYNAQSSTWKQYPTAMIVKVAEAFTLKRQFGISGLVTREEMAVQEDDVSPDSSPVNVSTSISASEEAAEVALEEPEEPEEPATEPEEDYPILEVIMGNSKNFYERDGCYVRTARFTDGDEVGAVMALTSEHIEQLRHAVGGKLHAVQVWDEASEKEKGTLPEPFRKGRVVIVGNTTRIKEEKKAV